MGIGFFNEDILLKKLSVKPSEKRCVKHNFQKINRQLSCFVRYVLLPNTYAKQITDSRS